jgi:recombination protein RecA
VRIEVRRVTTLKEGDEPVGNHVRARVVKNKVAPPFRTAEFDIMFNKGISYESDLVDLAATHDVVTKQGAWYSYGDVRLGQGRANAVSFLQENPDLTEEIRVGVLQRAAPHLAPEAPAKSADDEAEEDLDEESDD